MTRPVVSGTVDLCGVYSRGHNWQLWLFYFYLHCQLCFLGMWQNSNLNVVEIWQFSRIRIRRLYRETIFGWNRVWFSVKKLQIVLSAWPAEKCEIVKVNTATPTALKTRLSMLNNRQWRVGWNLNQLSWADRLVCWSAKWDQLLNSVCQSVQPISSASSWCSKSAF